MATSWSIRVAVITDYFAISIDKPHNVLQTEIFESLLPVSFV